MLPRKFLVIIGIIFILITGILIAIFSWKESKSISFVIEYPGASATISEKGSNTSFATVSNGSSLRLNKQKYDVTFTDKTFNQTPIEITVDDKTTSITLSPTLSSQKLKDLLSSEKDAIDAAIKGTIKNASRYAEGKRELYHFGEWCTTSFTVSAPASSNDPNIDNLDSAEVYYVILQKKDNKWSIVAGPHLIITKPDYPNIPDYVIDAIDPSRVQ